MRKDRKTLVFRTHRVITKITQNRITHKSRSRRITALFRMGNNNYGFFLSIVVLHKIEIRFLHVPHYNMINTHIYITTFYRTTQSVRGTRTRVLLSVPARLQCYYENSLQTPIALCII